jgi:sensor histidine kinase YesM
MVLGGLVISFIMHAIVPFPKHDHPRLYDHIATIIITIIVWEGNLWIDYFLNKKHPWEQNAMKRILVQLPISLIYSIVAIMIPMLVYDNFVCNVPIMRREAVVTSSTIIGLMVTLILLSAEIGIQFFKNWKKSLVEIEHYKAETLQAQLQNLKNQINPHFLFNNLSVLSSLVYKDQDKAVDFINQLSKVYRYLLDNRNSELVTLENELTFINSYIYLLQIRFDTNIQFKMDVTQEFLHKLIPPVSLQILIENAIKHNEISNDLPLTISIHIYENQLVVANNLQLRTNHEPSSKTGLQNIKDRYKHFTERELEIIESENNFVVKIPLLNN